MAKQIMRIVGVDGIIELRDDRVVIQRRGIINMIKYAGHTYREIPLGAISEVSFKPASMVVLGEIEFVRGGRSTEEKMRVNLSAVKFRKKHNKEFEIFKEKVFELMAKFNHHK